jgi:hypothetical protein
VKGNVKKNVLAGITMWLPGNVPLLNYMKVVSCKYEETENWYIDNVRTMCSQLDH